MRELRGLCGQEGLGKGAVPEQGLTNPDPYTHAFAVSLLPDGAPDPYPAGSSVSGPLCRCAGGRCAVPGPGVRGLADADRVLLVLNEDGRAGPSGGPGPVPVVSIDYFTGRLPHGQRALLDAHFPAAPPSCARMADVWAGCQD
jgi:hypothetical protein